MKEEIKQRFNELLAEGKIILSSIECDEFGFVYSLPSKDVPRNEKWIASTVNLLRMIDQSGGIFTNTTQSLVNYPELKHSIPFIVVQKLYGLLESAYEELQKGLLGKIEYIIVAEAFDNFLDHAVLYHKANKKTEASVLASVVLEDAVKRIGKKNGIEITGKPLELLIDELVKITVFTPVKAKRIKSCAGTRNHALHAEWESFDITDVGALINGTKELIENYL